MARLPVIAPAPPRTKFRFLLPPSLGPDEVASRCRPLEVHLTTALGRAVEVAVSANYDALAKDLLSGRADAAWAPAFVCARIEAMGVRVLARFVRDGAASYRSALLCRADRPVHADRLGGLSALWADRDSVGGHLLAVAYLRSRGLDPAKLFFHQEFAGSYRAALEGVLAGRADLTSIFAPPARAGHPDRHGVQDILPEHVNDFGVVAYTEEAPNDGVAVAMGVQPGMAAQLERTLLELEATEGGRRLLRDTFNAERFEAAPRMSYRALYRVALATI